MPQSPRSARGKPTVVKIPGKYLKAFRDEISIIHDPDFPGLLMVDVKMISRIQPQLLAELNEKFNVIFVPK